MASPRPRVRLLLPRNRRFVKILIANRGEIAVRVIRACREMGLPTVAVYSDCDRTSPHVRAADQAVHIGPSEAARSYLDIGRIVEAARQSGADAVHPGYGFLAENAAFASACRDAGLTFIGPSPDEIARAAGAIGYPLLVKAVAGGGGKGMRVVERPDDLASAIALARSEAGAAFGDASVYLERRLLRPRHIEIQLLGDHFGTIVPFVERECSIQRRHQKVVEESPSAAVSPALRARIASAAASVARAVGYTNAGTIEFLVDRDDRGAEAFYFLEMNTRLQVEHPVTEMVTGVDLVQWQIRIARGERLTIDPARALSPEGHAIECRIYAEDPDRNFMPSPGLIRGLRPASGPGIRDDSGVAPGYTVPVYYDSMIAKLVAWAGSRDEAIARMARALEEYRVLGIRTTIPLFAWLMRQEDYRAARYDTSWLDRAMAARETSFSELAPGDETLIAIAAAMDAYLRARAGTTAAPGAPDVSLWQRAARSEALRG
jgi:acetyl-CoA carboxylase biotin carboxylase subunit